jgi:hypothetical protein
MKEKKRGMERTQTVWKRVPGSRIPVDLVLLPCLGLVAYFLFRHAEALTPAEGALLVVAVAGLLRLGLQWWGWQQRLTRDGILVDWIQRILDGERESQPVPAGLSGQDSRAAGALNRVLEDLQDQSSALAGLRRALTRDWQELDGLLGAIQHQHEVEAEVWQQGRLRLAALGRDLKAAFEDTLRFDQIELNCRLRADQSRLQGQAFRGALEQLRTGLDQFENHLEELQGTFPRLRREEDALRRLADAGLRQGARLNLSTKGLVAHASRLVDDARSRTEGLRKLRESADRVRDQTEALARRMEGAREEALVRIHSFGGARGSLKGLDQVAQQTGLLAVNAAILAQQESGSAGLTAIGGRLRFLADQTAEGAAGMERVLGDYQQGLEHETAGLWDLQEVTRKLLAEVHELLRTAGHMDQQGQDLERALEAHLGLVDQLRQSSDRTELSLHEVNARALALEAAHGRQWSVEAKLAPEHERLARMGKRLAEVGDGLIHNSQQNIDEIWAILSRHQEVRRTEAYRQVASEGLPRLMDAPQDTEAMWNAVAWARAQRHPRLEQSCGRLLPAGRLGPNGALRLLILSQDALQRPEASALESWTCDSTGQLWELHLLVSLRTEGHRLALLALLRESPLAAVFPGVEMRITFEGVRIDLPHSYPRLPDFLAGLRLELPVEPDLWNHPFQEAILRTAAVQRLIWIGPGQGGSGQHPWIRQAHAWVQKEPQHKCFLPWLPYKRQRPHCPLSGDDDVPATSSDPMTVCCLGLGADPASLQAFHERFLAAGAVEGPGGLALCAVDIGHPHPEALLLRLFQPGLDLAGSFHPDLVPYQIRVREDVLGGAAADPYRAAWSILEDLQREGWLMPLPSE